MENYDKFVHINVNMSFGRRSHRRSMLPFVVEWHLYENAYAYAHT